MSGAVPRSAVPLTHILPKLLLVGIMLCFLVTVGFFCWQYFGVQGYGVTWLTSLNNARESTHTVMSSWIRFPWA